MEHRITNSKFVLISVLGFVALAFSFYLLKNPYQFKFGDKSVLPQPSESGGIEKTYLNKKFGFQFKYPAEFVEREYDGSGEAALYCGKALDRAVLWSSRQEYRVTVYSNPQAISIKDFFVCIKAAESLGAFDGDDIVAVEFFQPGGQPVEAAHVVYRAGEKKFKDAVVSSGSNIIVVAPVKSFDDAGGESDFKKIIDSLIVPPAEAIANSDFEAKSFCASDIPGKSENGPMVFSLDLGNGKGICAGCAVNATADREEWRSGEPVRIYHFERNEADGYRIIWKEQGVPQAREGEKAENSFGWTIFKKAVSAGDIDNDGANEIIFSGNQYDGAECPKECQNWCLYSAVKNDVYCVSICNYWGEAAQVGSAGNDDCEPQEVLPVEGGECGNKKIRIKCFDTANLKNEGNKIYRDYLEKNAVPDIWPDSVGGR